MKILFICRYNRFRSVLAEGLFNKLNKNKNNKAKSAGLIRGSRIDKNTKNLAKKLKIKIKEKPEAISSKLLSWQEQVIIIADNVPKSIFKDQKNVKKIKVWKIKDAKNDKASVPLSYNIESKIKSLINNLTK